MLFAFGFAAEGVAEETRHVVELEEDGDDEMFCSHPIGTGFT